MRAGLPVVASNVGGVAELVADAETGFLLDPSLEEEEAAKQLSSVLGALIEDPEIRQRLGAAARREYEDHFTFERMAEETASLYRSLLDQRTERT